MLKSFDIFSIKFLNEYFKVSILITISLTVEAKIVLSFLKHKTKLILFDLIWLKFS